MPVPVSQRYPGTPYKDLRGLRYGDLECIDFVEYDPVHERSFWKWKCHRCGTGERIAPANLIKASTYQDCGCSRHHGLESLLYHRYRHIIDRHLKYGGTEEDRIPFGLWKHMVTQPCHYCGAEPDQPVRRHPEGKEPGPIHMYVNGIDRIDSNKPYTLENVVSCCKWCNIAKNNHPTDDFLAHCMAVIEHQKKKD